MKGAKIGGLVGILGSCLMIAFGIIFFGEYNVDLMRDGQVFAYIRLAFALGLDSAGIIGGILTFAGKEFGTLIPLTGAIIALIGFFVPIGGFEFYIDPEYVYFPMTLYSTFYVEIVLMGVGTVISLVV